MNAGLAPSLSFLLGMLLIVAAVVRAVWMLVCRPAEPAALCPRCQYPVDPRLGLRCSECGTDAPDSSELYLRRRTWKGYALVCCVMVMGVLCATVVPDLIRYGRWVLVPNAALVRWRPNAGPAAENELFRRLDANRISEQDVNALLMQAESQITSPAISIQQSGWKLLWSLERHSGKGAWKVIEAALHDTDPLVREAAIRQVNTSHAKYPDWLVPKFVDIVANDPSTPVRRRALAACAGHLSEAEDPVSVIVAYQQPASLEFQCLEGVVRGDVEAIKWWYQLLRHLKEQDAAGP